MTASESTQGLLEGSVLPAREVAWLLPAFPPGAGAEAREPVGPRPLGAPRSSVGRLG